MIKAAIEKIQQMCQEHITEVDGNSYLISNDGNITQIKPEPEYPSSIDLCSLDALVKFVKTEAVHNHDMVYVTVPCHKTVSCFSHPYKELQERRVYLYEAHATDVPGWGEKTTMSFEEALIALRTRFESTSDTEYALKLLSDITTGSKVTYNDNGVATSVVTKTGIDLQKNAAIRPIITLRPYRTFQEVEQPTSLFLIRINERGITFVEADGGMWKLNARNAVKKYLETALESEISVGKVVVTL